MPSSKKLGVSGKEGRERVVRLTMSLNLGMDKNHSMLGQDYIVDGRKLLT